MKSTLWMVLVLTVIGFGLIAVLAPKAWQEISALEHQRPDRPQILVSPTDSARLPDHPVQSASSITIATIETSVPRSGVAAPSNFIPSVNPILPFSLLLALPLAILPGWLKRGIFGQETLALTPPWLRRDKEQIASRQPPRERRAHPRHQPPGIKAHISDGTHYWLGTVHDLSRTGVCLINPIEITEIQTDTLSLLLAGYGRSVQVHIRPMWSRNSAGKLLLGGIVLDNHWNWAMFGRQFEGEQTDN
jgi:hypothetical protein